MSPARLLGGAVGARAERAGVWFTAGPWVMLAGTLSFLVLMIRQIPCQTGADIYASMCYSDIRPLFYARGLAEGKIPFITADVEYPVLTGALMELSRRLTMLLGGQTGPDLDDSAISHAADLFVGVNAWLLFGFFLVTLWAHVRMSRPWDALMIAVSPAVLTTGLINWDFMVLAFTALGLLSWSRRRPVWSGIWLGLGIAAKLYPLLFFVPLAVLCLRSSRLRAFWLAVVGAAGSWVAVNLPVYLISPAGWLHFWTFNVDRGADLGSIWYVMSLAGKGIEDVSRAQSVGMVLGTIVICVLLLVTPQRPRLAHGMLLILVLFLVVNKVYSPQYVLWLLPLVVLARPNWLDWTLFSIAEVAYFAAIWGHLGGTLTSGAGGPDRLYWAAVLLRIGVQLWICGRVIFDMFHPEFDPVRAALAGSAVDRRTVGARDPDGGVLDDAPDARWLTAMPWRR